MRKILATLLAAVTVAGSLMGAGVSSAQARDRFLPGRGGGHAFGGHHGFGGHPGFGRHPGFAGNRGFYGGRHRFYGGGRRYYGGGYYGRPYYGGYYDGYDDDGGAVAAGIFGLAAGAMLGSALSHHHHAYGGSCAARFRTYNRATGTYMGYDGRPHRCP